MVDNIILLGEKKTLDLNVETLQKVRDFLMNLPTLDSKAKETLYAEMKDQIEIAKNKNIEAIKKREAELDKLRVVVKQEIFESILIDLPDNFGRNERINYIKKITGLNKKTENTNSILGEMLNFPTRLIPGDLLLIVCAKGNHQTRSIVVKLKSATEFDVLKELPASEKYMFFWDVIEQHLKK